MCERGEEGRGREGEREKATRRRLPGDGENDYYYDEYDEENETHEPDE